MALWVALYREFAPQYGFGFVDDPLRVRRLRDGSHRDMVFDRGEVAGSYIGRYLGGGQLERAMWAEDRSWRLWWISPVLLRQSGWSLQRCRWIRQGWHVKHGTWHGGGNAVMGRLSTRLPSWWFRPEDRAWVSAVVGIP